jgi:hypothetical protein
MTVVKNLEIIKDWLQKDICRHFKFKRPPECEEAEAEEYECEYVHPEAFVMYPPPSRKFPSVVVQFGDGEEDRNTETGELKIRLLFATWNPGLHFIDEGNVPNFKVNHEGWRDVWNFIDYTLRAIRNTDIVGESIRIKHENGIKFGNVTEQDAAANYYPHWVGWISFTIRYGTNSINLFDDDISALI